MPNKPKFYIGIKNEVSSGTLELYFTDYIYDGWDWSTYEPVNMVQDTIDKIKAANPTTIKIIINSLGGDVMIGLALYNYLKAYNAEKEVDIIGFAASIASIIAMCASPGKLRMATNSFMIIHAAWGVAEGNADEMREAANNLDKVTNELAEIYAQRSGKHDAAFFKDLWKDGDHWLTGNEALEMGLADELINAPVVNAKFDFTIYNFKHIPAGVQSAQADDHKGFFSNLKNDFMKLIDTLRNAVTGAKDDKKTDTVPNKQEILDLVQSVLTPFAEALDEKLPDDEDEQDTTDTTDTGGADDGKGGKKKEEKTDTGTGTDDKTELQNLKNEMQQLRASIAANASLPQDDKTKTDQPVGEIELEK